MSGPVREGPVGQMAAVVTDIEKLVAVGHADRQLNLVGEHWRSVDRLWLSEPDVPAARRVREALPPEFEVGCGMPGWGTIKPARGGRFKFVEDGLTAVILPAYDCIPAMVGANPERHVEELRDLIAVDLDRPYRFWRRRGEAVILGTAFLEIAGDECEPVPVFSTPMSWLRSGGAGIVILDRNCTRHLLLDHEIVAEDLALGRRLATALKPHILVTEAA